MKFKITILKTAAVTFFLSIALLGQVLAQQPFPPVYPTGSLINFVRTWDASAPEQDGNVLMNRALRDVKMTTQYIDGLGRPIQTVVKEGSLNTGSSPTDIVSSIVYDEFGREKIKYMPFAEPVFNNGLFKTNPFTAQANFYSSQLTGQSGETSPVNSPNWAYSLTNFEASPLNRPEKSMSPGASWVGSSRGVEMKYWINTLDD
ncbi:MAG: DUF6443 domain-containing protein, partial [Ferruginibacter sp.]